MLVSYNWLTDYLGTDIPSPDELAELLTFHAFEIEGVETVGDDTVIDVDVLPNRSSDCLSHRGIAREIATLLDRPLVHDPLRDTSETVATDAIMADIDDTVACPRFTAQVLTDVMVGPSPDWLQERLRALGQRPINNIVDATNYVMYALGQPLHAYDADAFPQSKGVWQFAVRPAEAGETIDLLGEGADADERQLTLSGGETLIVDATSGTPIGLAGVKGGRYAGVTEATTRIIVEAAHFDPVRTRTTARANHIIIDASKRFENEPSPELPPYAQAAIAQLLSDIADAKPEGMIDVYPEPQPAVTVSVEPAAANRLLGLSLTSEAMVSLLERAGCTVEMVNETMHCTGPFERTDLQIAEDFIEEIGRIHGYEHVSAVLPEAAPLTEYNAVHYYSEVVRAALTSLGFSEIITSTFRKKDSIKLHNALASDKNHLRSTLRKNIAEALVKNAPHTDLLGTSDTRLFEIGTVMEKGDGHVQEHVSLALGVQVKPSGYTGKEDKVVAEARMAIEEALGVAVIWEEQNGVAEMNLSAVVAALPQPTSYAPVAVPEQPAQYRPFSVYPAISRDIALWVDGDTTAATVATTVQSAIITDAPSWSEPGGVVGRLVQGADAVPIYLQRLDCFDTFSKDGQTSYAFRLVFQSYETTLTDAAVNAVMEQVYSAVAEEGWTVR